MEVNGITRFLLPFGVLLLAGYLSFLFSIPFIFYQRLKRLNRLWVIPLIFTGIEFLRSLTSSLGFTWGSIAYTQTPYPFLIQIASFGGMYLITVMILFINLLIFLSIKKRQWKYSIWALSIILFSLFYSIFIIHRGYTKVGTIPVAIVQPNVNPEIKHPGDREKRMEIIRNALINIHPVKLVILPETASPCFALYENNCKEFFQSLSIKNNFAILTGTPDVKYIASTRKFHYYNTAALFSPNYPPQKYNKIYLVPFGERLPFDNVIKPLRRINLGQGNYWPGKEFKIFHIRGAKFSTMICFESIFSRLVRRFVKEGAEFLVNITEDSWFGRTSGPFEHFGMVIMRTVEYRRELVRSANTGVSGIIDPFGRVIKRTKIFQKKILYTDIPLIKSTTIYTHIGDFFPWMFILISIAGIYEKRKYFRHRSAYVEKRAKIGKGTKIWYFSHIMSGAVIGENCVIGQNCFIGGRARIGNGVKLENNVSVFDLVTLEDNVFVGPSVTFTNDPNPRAPYPKGGKWVPTYVKEGATIGANATILPGVVIGKWAMIGAGSIITKDVPDYAIVYGTASQIKAWICECGETLKFQEDEAICKKCGRRYIKDGNKVREKN